jgi:aminocarboxymuconate-semialdehyde decarboxylase
MRIDAWTHLLSPAYVEQLQRRELPARASFFLAQRALHDLELRLRTIDDQPDYLQVLTPLPGPLVFETGITPAELARKNNDQLAKITQRHADQFAGFAAATPLTDPDAATAEAIRAVTDLGALGVQLKADAVNLPLHEPRYEPLFTALEELGAAVWLHPCRTPGRPGSPPTPLPSSCGKS